MSNEPGQGPPQILQAWSPAAGNPGNLVHCLDTATHQPHIWEAPNGRRACPGWPDLSGRQLPAGTGPAADPRILGLVERHAQPIDPTKPRPGFAGLGLTAADLDACDRAIAILWEHHTLAAGDWPQMLAAMDGDEREAICAAVERAHRAAGQPSPDTRLLRAWQPLPSPPGE